MATPSKASPTKMPRAAENFFHQSIDTSHMFEKEGKRQTGKVKGRSVNKDALRLLLLRFFMTIEVNASAKYTCVCVFICSCMY